MKKEIKLTWTHEQLATARKRRWPLADNSVDEMSVQNLVSMLTPAERIHFVNELWRVLKPGAKAQITTPHWCSSRAYSDLTFVYPPVAEGWYFHLNEAWRKANAPWGKAYRCDFDITFGYGLHPHVVTRNQEYQQHAVTFFKEAAQDVVAALTKRKPVPVG